MLSSYKLFIIFLFGLISGFTLMITGNTLNYWLAKEALDLQTIGIFAFILIPYSINFLWAPIFDTVYLGYLSKILGHRLSWICVIQFFLALFIFLLSILDPKYNLIIFALIGVVIAFLSSAQDAILGALRTEIIAKESQGATAGIYIFGYRIGMLISGPAAIYLSAHLGWSSIYKIFAILVLVYSVILTISLLHPKNRPPRTILIHKKREWINSSTFIQNILKPVGPFSLTLTIIVFLILYRLPDNFINMMINPFLIHIGYNELEIASTGKFLGIVSAIMGGLIASFIMRKKNILDSLLLFGILHMFAHSLLILQEICGKNLLLLFITVGFESITSGMAMAAYIAFIASICQGRFRATQYSFFTAMMGFSRSIFPALSGYVVVQLGWQNFFLFIIIITLPSLLLLRKLRSLLI